MLDMNFSKEELELIVEVFDSIEECGFDITERMTSEVKYKYDLGNKINKKIKERLENVNDK